MLVCTCIGEEGLDIGEVDLVINVDSLSSSIRSQQRAGRTGRKREGRVVYLLCEGAELEKYNKAKSKAKSVAMSMKSARQKYVFDTPQYTLFPNGIKPRQVQKR